MTISKRDMLKGLGAGAAVLATPMIARAAPLQLKCSHYLPPQHQINTALNAWADALRAETGGELDIKVFAAGQMAPPPRQYDLARNGVAEMAFVFTAFHPGRFPLTDLLSLPFLLVDENAAPRPGADTSWLATRLKPELSADYRGVEMLFSICLSSTGFFMRDKQVMTPADVDGLRIRPTSGAMAEQLKAMGASPATVAPTELADALGKGVVDGAIFNFEGGRAFQLHQAVTKVSTLANSAATFSLVANEDAMASMPKKFSDLIRETTGPDMGREIGGLYDEAEAAGRAFMEGEGVAVVDLVGDKADPFRAAVAPVGERQLAETRAKHDTTDAVLKRIEQLLAEI